MEYITIKKCPLCEKSHTYELDVKRSYIIKMAIFDDQPDFGSLYRFTRLFNCPNKNENFQAKVALINKSINKIDSVNIKGIKNG